MLLAKGKVIYFNTKDNAVPYFKSIGFECPPLTTPSDYFMSIMSVESIEKEDIDPNDKDAQESSTALIMNTYNELIEKFHNSYQASELKNDPSRTFEGMKALDFDRFFQDKNMGWCNEFWMLLKRNMISIVRIPLTSFILVVATAIQAAVAVLIYQNIDETKSGVQDRRGVLFYIILVMGFGGVNNVVQVFPVERPVFLRESNNNLYRVSTYFWSKVVSQLPTSILVPTMFVSIVYFSVGLTLSHWSKPLISILGAILEYNAFVGFGYIIGTGVGDKQVATVLTPVAIVPMLLYAGFFVSQDNIPKWLWWFREVAIFKYGFQVQFLNEFSDLELECMKTADLQAKCDPLGDFDSPQSLELSLLLLVVLWAAFFAIAFLIMICLQAPKRAKSTSRRSKAVTAN